MINKLQNDMNRRMIWAYSKYQLLTKGLLALLVLPLFRWLIQRILLASGRTVISSGDYLSFLFSFQGLQLLVVALFLLTLLVGLDINAFILMSARFQRQREVPGTKEMLLMGVRSLKAFLSPKGLLILLYVAFVIPLISVGVSLSPLKNFQIPNFITSVIFGNPLFMGLYVGLLIVLAVVTFFYFFAFHFILLEKKKIPDALKSSVSLMKKNWKNFLLEGFGKGLLRILVVCLIAYLLIVLLTLPVRIFAFPTALSRFWMLFSMFILLEYFAIVALMAVPVAVSEVTGLFIRYTENSESTDKTLPKSENSVVKGGKSHLLGFCLGLLALTLAGAIFCTIYFDQIFLPERNTLLVAHRAGGNLAAENSLEGLKRAIDLGADWSEIDVQRTRDGHYVINHDPSFKRTTGVNKSSVDMNLAEIKELKVQDAFDPNRPAQEVATLEEFLDTAKGQIGLFVELKGATADEQMVDDVVQMIRERKMEDETVLLSLDYELIQTIEQKYPEMKSGFLYFFAIGDLATMKGDYLIMEEAEATPKKIAEIQDAGKMAVVWTVNTEVSIQKYVHSKVDGIITDEPLAVKEAMEESRNLSDFNAIKGKLFGF